ncbi:hypothetical protein V2G26_019306 [Clonostachys chloroleuca]
MASTSDEKSVVSPQAPDKADQTLNSKKTQAGTGTVDVETGQLHALEKEPLPPFTESDDPFGGEGGNNYRTMGRWDTVFALVTNQMGLGILSLPGTLKILGLVPGLIAIFAIGSLTWYAGYVLYEFYARYPFVINLVEMVKVIGGKRWEAVAFSMFIFQLVLTGASTAVTLSIVFNSISEHAMCTVGFIGIACLVIFIFCIPRTMKFVSQSGIPCFLSITVGALVTMIGLGVGHPAKAPADWKLGSGLTIAGHPSFQQGLTACIRIFFAFAGNFAFCSYMAEMKDPVRDFPFALRGLFIASMSVYAAFAAILYVLAGEYTTSPALGSAPLVYAKAAYGIVIPAVLTSGLSNGHIAIKLVHVQVMRAMNLTKEITANTFRSWAIWIGIGIAFWVISFIISNAIPIFDSIVSISSCATYSWTTWGIAGFLWLHLNKGSWFSTWKKRGLFCLNVSLIVLSLFMNSAGLWASISELLDAFKTGSGVRGCFDCGDNSSL